mgnify:CR=1 FL=1
MDAEVFRTAEDGTLELVGDFDGLYRRVADPWGQSSFDLHLGAYYDRSRTNLFACLQRRRPIISLMEVGCGHGHVSGALRRLVASVVVGVDVSPTALVRARELYPDCGFECADLTQPGLDLGQQHDVVLWGQCLWYLMHEMGVALENSMAHLRVGGLLVVQQAFLRDQRYGRGMVDGFAGMLDVVGRALGGQALLVEARLEEHDDVYSDGLAVWRRVS